MTKVLVTGASGFIGANVTRLLLKEGFHIRALVRRSSNRQNLEGLDIEVVEGDLTDSDSLKRALRGCEQLYHMAALYEFWTKDPQNFYKINVEGTENIFKSAKASSLSKIIYTSTVGVLKYPTDPSCPSDEKAIPTNEDLHNDYKRSKFQAEQIALRFAKAGLPIIIVNPSAPIGPFDIKPTPTGKIIVDFLRGQIPAYINTGLNIIDVEDVAMGHLLAAKRGRIGEKYILGNQNMSLKEIYELLAKLSQKRAPFLRVPYGFAWALAFGSEVFSQFSKKRPRIPLGAVRMAKQHMYFDSTKAVKELGLPQNPVEKAFEKAIQWFEEKGYLK